MNLRHLKGLGPKSEAALNEIGIYTGEQLAEIGPVRAYLKLQQASPSKISLNFLYAMVGAVEDKDWREIAKNDKYSLLIALDGFKELQEQLKKEGKTFDI